MTTAEALLFGSVFGLALGIGSRAIWLLWKAGE